MTVERTRPRREPKQERSRQTVDDVFQAVRLVVRRHGTEALTTNRIAEAAGVSVGSLYQYFPDKRAIFAALHDRHVDDVRRVLEQTTAACASASLAEFARQLVHGLVDAHDNVAELHEVLSSAVPGSGPGFTRSLQRTFERVLLQADHADRGRYGPAETQRMLFVLPRMVESLVHGTTQAARGALSRGDARREVIRAVEVYVNSCERRTASRTY